MRMTNSDTPLKSLVACSLVAILFAPVATATVGDSRKPNIVVILSDDMGFSDIGCYGGEINTPTLDSLAAGGLRFTQFYNTARCCPTRASLLTGLYPHQAGVGHMTDDKGEKFPGYRGGLNQNCVTIAEVLKPAGYRNYAVGKWHVTLNAHLKNDGPKPTWPRQRGFDRFYGMISGGGSFYDPWTLARDNQLISPYADPEYKPDRYYFTDAISDHAARFVGDHVRDYAGQPFFMYVAFTAAHWPMHALPEDIARYKGKYDGGYEPIRKARFEKATRLGLIDPKQGMTVQTGDWDKVANKPREIACMEVYAAMIDRMDCGIGRLVAELKRTGLFDNTLIFYLQDNGGCAEEMGRGVTKDRIDGPRADRPMLDPIPPETLPAALVPPQTRDGYPVRQGPNVMPGPYDTFVAYGRGWANVSNTPFREYKHWVHEGGISTPLIVHWPAGIRREKGVGSLLPERPEGCFAQKTPDPFFPSRTQPGHLIDIMATCVDVSGAKYPNQSGGRPITPPEGKSLVPAFANLPLDRDAIFWEHEGNRAVRAGDWKLVAKGPGGPWELYDLKTDRVEANNLAAENPAKAKELAAKWETWASRANVIPWIWEPEFKPVAADPRSSAEASKANAQHRSFNDAGSPTATPSH